MQDAVKRAIQEKCLLEFTYKGHKRVIEPHVLGVKDGAVQVLGYQVDGTSQSGTVPDWRRFDLNLITGLHQLVGSRFAGPRAFPSGKHSSWDYHIEIVR